MRPRFESIISLCGLQKDWKIINYLCNFLRYLIGRIYLHAKSHIQVQVAKP
jgi:hypothetical protein